MIDDEIILGKTEKSTAIITGVELSKDNPETEQIMSEEQENKILYATTLAITVILFITIYMW